MTEPDYIVLRASPDVPPGWMPRGLDGRWYDRAQFVEGLERPADLPRWHATAVPTGRFEVRDHDGAVAEVWEARQAAAESGPPR